MRLESLKAENKKFGEIIVYPLNDELKADLLSLAMDNTKDGKMILDEPELIGKYILLCTNIPKEFIEDEELFKDILKNPTDDFEDAMQELTYMIQRFFNRFTKQVDTLGQLPDSVLKELVENKKIDKNILEFPQNN